MASSSKNIQCKVIKSFRSPKKNGGNVIYKEFKEGQKVNGSLIDSKMFQTTDGFMIPKVNLNPIFSNSNGSTEDVEYAEIVEDKPKTFKMPSDIKADMANILKSKSKIAVNAGLAGLVAGFIYAVAKGKSKLLFSALGSVVGFVAGNAYNNYVKEDQK